MKIKNILVWVATLGPVGYVRGSGTLATIITLPVVYVCYYSTDWVLGTLAVLLLFVVAVVAIRRALCVFEREHDPSQIVMDEVVGCLVTFYAIPLTATTVVLGFLLFRFFDIFKPFGIRRLEDLSGVWGVMADDIVAGVLSNIILYFFSYYLLV